MVDNSDDNDQSGKYLSDAQIAAMTSEQRQAYNVALQKSISLLAIGNALQREKNALLAQEIAEREAASGPSSLDQIINTALGVQWGMWLSGK